MPLRASCASRQGPSPLPQRHAGIRTSRGPKSPRPAPAPPPASARPAPGGRFAPAGSGAGLCCAGGIGPVWSVPSGRGKTRIAFRGPARRGEGPFIAAMAGAIAPATAPRRDQDQPGAHSPRPAPAPPPAGASRPPGRALASVFPGPAGLQGTVAQGRGKRGSRFHFPPAQTTAPPASMAGAIVPATAPHWHQNQPGAQKPPASARPAHGGRFAPAGSGAGLCPSRTCRSAGHRLERAGKRGSRFLFPPAQTTVLPPLPWQGPSPLPQRHTDPWPAGGPKPPASARPAGSGAGLSWCRDPPD